MMKFFRKYMKQMLAVFVCLLLVVWLGGTALQSFLAPNPGKMLVGYAFDRKILRKNLQSADGETQMLYQIGLPWSRPWMMMQARFSPSLRNMKDLQSLDWYLLRQEAGRQGVPATNMEIDQVLTSIDPQGQLRQRTQKRMNVSLDYIHRSVGNYLRVSKLARIVSESAKVSEPELKRAIADFQEKVEVRLVLLNGKTFEDQAGLPSEADLEKHFKAYQDIPEGQGKYGFGYRFPERVRIEYLSVDTQALAKLVPVSERQARRYWKANKETPIFRRPSPASTQPTTATSTPTTGPTTADTPASTQASTRPTTKPVEYYTTFSQAKKTALDHLRTERAGEEAQRLMNDIISQLSVDFSAGKLQKDGYRTAPEPVKTSDYFASVYERFRKTRYGSALRLHTGNKLMTADELQRLEGIGRARLSRGGGRPSLDFVDLAFQVQGLRKIPKDKDVERSHYMSLYQTFVSPLQGADNKYYIFRVVAVEKPRPAKSLAEVADRVKADVLALRAHAAAGKAAGNIEKKAKQSSLEEAWASQEALKKKVGPLEGFQTPKPFGRKGLSAPGIGADEEFADACFALAAEKPEAQADKVRLIELPKSRKWAVVEFVKLHPMIKDQYQAMKMFMRQNLTIQKQGKVLSAWFQPSNIRKRTRFSFATGQDR